MTLLGLRYYCPEGIPRPPHRDDLQPARCVEGKGPDVAAGGPGGGMCYGGTYRDGEAGWKLTPGGWYIHVGPHALPQQLVRMNLPAEVTSWVDVPGGFDLHFWRVPILLRRARGEAGSTSATYVSALDRVWCGERGWTTDSPLRDTQERLLRVALGLAVTGDVSKDNAALTALAIELLRSGQRIDEHGTELVVTGWLTERLMLRTVMAAGSIGVEPAHAA